MRRTGTRLVSVIVPTYGRPAFLKEAVASVANQTYRPVQLVVVDDASPEPIDVHSLGLPAVDPGFIVTVVCHDRNSGPGAARNTGVEHAVGDFVVFLDDDDELLPDRIASGVEAIGSARMHACGVSGADRPSYSGDMTRTILRGPIPATGQVMIRREDFVPFDESLRVSEDVDWWARMAPKAVFAWTPQPLLSVRTHDGPRPGVDARVRAECRRIVTERHAASFDRATRAVQFARCASAFFLAGEKSGTALWSARSLMARPNALGLKLLFKSMRMSPGGTDRSASFRTSSDVPPSTRLLDTSFISVVIPVRNMADLLSVQVEALTAMRTSRRFEVLIVDNGSTDQTRATADRLAAMHSNVQVLEATTPGPNVARNAGIRAAQADVVALCDADDAVHPDWLDEIVAPMSADSYVGGAVVRGGVNTPSVQRRWSADPAKSQVPISRIGGVPAPISASCAFPKEMWERIGGFDEGLPIGGDESEFFVRAARAGYRCVEAPGAKIDYRLPATARAVWRRGRNYGANGWRVRHAAGDRRRLSVNIKQVVLLVASLPSAIVSDRGRYVVLHNLAKRFGETSAMSAHAVTWIRMVVGSVPERP